MSLRFSNYITWLEKFFLGEDEDDKHRKRKSVLLTASFVFMSYTLVVTISVLILRQRIISYYGISMFLTYFLFFSFVKITKNIDVVFFIELIVIIIHTALFIVLLGGIPYSGGIVLSGLVATIFSIHFERIKWSLILFLLYSLSLIIAGILQPIVKIEPQMPPTVNLILFIIFSVFLCGLTTLFIADVVNERIRIQEFMVNKLRELDTTKTNLYTNITHEFRTPITVILGITEILSDQLDSRQKEDLSLISRNGEKLLKLVNQMLDLAKLDSGTIELDKINGNIIELLDYVVASFESISKQKNTRLHKLYDTPEIFMDFDPEKMESILTNLLDNALKNTENGDIYIMISPEKEHNNLIIKIKDTGSGIPAELASKIFDRFFQVEKSESGLSGGTGIGLAIVKEYIQLMGGEISVKSEIDKGTEFTIQIPVINELTTTDVPLRKRIAGHQNTVEESIRPKDKKDLPVLLIIEDNQDLTRFLIKMLNDEFEIVAANNGKEGVDKALEHIPDIIISDVMMPEMNGFEVTDRLKNDLRTSHIPVLLLTAKADEKSKLAGLSKGADAYMVKPFNKKELIVRLENLVDLRRKLKSRYKYYIPELIQSGKGTSLDEVFLKKVKNDLEKNYSDENYNTEQLCQNIGMSRVQLFRKLKALTGKVPSLMIRSYRLEKARNLIVSTDRQIAEIAYNCGFGNAAYFTQVFSEIYGVSPTQMRNSEFDSVT
ncbi:hybrid sensor histidine kinase/response regulator transcription factor [Maribellus mangrovi]|uniref:hybrid sensor histidine kinase/response regulator transcription factor n=1 Tax=Maribellus mangrovi TaxID=3133146 RepID=UPI0030ED3D08